MKPIFNSPDKKVIFFDLYDTLIDREKSFTQALNESLMEFTARWDDQHWSPSAVVDMYRKEWSKQSTYAKKAKAHTKKRKLVRTKKMRQLLCLAKSLQDAPFEVTESFVQTLLQRTKALTLQHTSLYPDVRTTLEQLKQQYTLSIISRSEEHTSELQSRPHLVCRL